MILTPAYGRDYGSAKGVIADLVAGKDFLVANLVRSVPINLAQIVAAGVREVRVRYAGQRRVVRLAISVDSQGVVTVDRA